MPEVMFTPGGNPIMAVRDISVLAGPPEDVFTPDGNYIQAVRLYDSDGLPSAGGGGAVTFPLLAPNGTVGAPSYSFTSQTNAGLWTPYAGAIDVSITGLSVFRLQNDGSLFQRPGGVMGWTAGEFFVGIANDTGLSRISAATIGVGNGAAGSNIGGLRAGAINNLGTATGAVNVMAVAPAVSIGAYTTGAIYLVQANITNTTTTPTLNINTLGAKTIVKRAATAVAAGDYLTNMWCQFLYDGTNMVLLNPVVN